MISYEIVEWFRDVESLLNHLDRNGVNQYDVTGNKKEAELRFKYRSSPQFFFEKVSHSGKDYYFLNKVIKLRF